MALQVGSLCFLLLVGDASEPFLSHSLSLHALLLLCFSAMMVRDAYHSGTLGPHTLFLLHVALVRCLYHSDGKVTYTPLIHLVILFCHSQELQFLLIERVFESFDLLQMTGLGCAWGFCPLFGWLPLTPRAPTIPYPHTTDTDKIMANFLFRILQWSPYSPCTKYSCHSRLQFREFLFPLFLTCHLKSF